jgi:light-regulated signal transduction histidine kinase (bacteriophytochrome)
LRKEQVEKLEQELKSSQIFFSMCIHDMRNPNNAIKACLTFAVSTLKDLLRMKDEFEKHTKAIISFQVLHRSEVDQILKDEALSLGPIKRVEFLVDFIEMESARLSSFMLEEEGEGTGSVELGDFEKYC